MASIAERVEAELSKPAGCMVERFWVMDDAGLYFAGDDEFTYEQDHAFAFKRLDEAEEIAAVYAGTSVQRFECFSNIPDPLAKTDPKWALSEALNYVQHWRRDRDDNMLPTVATLDHVESVIRNALAASAPARLEAAE